MLNPLPGPGSILEKFQDVSKPRQGVLPQRLVVETGRLQAFSPRKLLFSTIADVRFDAGGGPCPSERRSSGLNSARDSAQLAATDDLRKSMPRVATCIAIATLGTGCLHRIEIPYPRSPGESAWRLNAVLYKPDGPGPFPLVVINHGFAALRDRARQTYNPFVEQSRWFVKRGFVVVVPSRRGYGGSDGPYSESPGTCADADYQLAALETARDIRVVIDFMAKQPFVDGRRIVLVGHSAGGLGALALASLNPPGVVGAISFAGGRGAIGPDRVCSPSHLRAAFSEFGRTSTIPTLWLYASNDHFFSPALARGWYDEYIRAGGRAQFVELSDYGVDGHELFDSSTSLPLWTGPVAQFLSELGFTAGVLPSVR